jgi:glycosyltransferase involved in cell wall biosynthesis
MFRDKDKVHVAWIGSTNINSGYGSSNYNLLQALAGTNVKVHLKGTEYQADDCDVSIGYGTADQGLLDALPGKHVIMLTMFEADKWPVSWVDTLNCANEVWVPSEFCKDTLIESGCTSPVHVVPLGVDLEQFYPMQQKRVGSVFTFGYAGACTYRKGIDVLCRAFAEEFGENDNAQLKILSSNVLPSTIPIHPRIKLISGKFSTDEIRRFYSSLDLFVMPTRGEGIGLTPLEAMACGTAAAVTEGSGCTDYMGTHMLPIDIDRLIPCNSYHGSQGNFVEPSIKSVREVMRYAYEHRSEMHQMGEAAAVYVAENWTYAHSAARIESLLSKIKLRGRVRSESRKVAVWTGSPKNITTRAGGFVRYEPRDLTPAIEVAIAGDDRFRIETRYRRVDNREARGNREATK